MWVTPKLQLPDYQYLQISSCNFFVNFYDKTTTFESLLKDYAQTLGTMARPIKETPVLKGDDAKRFTELAERAFKNPVSEKVKNRIQANYAKIKAAALK